MPFRLHKWYFDCVAPSGAAAIGYSAQLRWGVLDLGYGALIHAEPEREPTQVQTWRFRPPRWQDGKLEWTDSRLRADGAWEGLAPGPEIALLEGVRWRCHQPGGPARLRRSVGAELHGLGYAEELVLELPPWRLPFAELRWGRFIADAGGPSLAWIQWREGLDRGWCFRDGLPLELQSCSDDRVAFSGGQLALQGVRTLREGLLLREILGAAAVLCPGPLRRAHEAKELARGMLEDSSGSTAGWVIHERVRLR